jgi:hypothetical protein
MAVTFTSTPTEIMSIEAYLDQIRRQINFKTGNLLNPQKLIMILEEIADPSSGEPDVSVNALHKVVLALNN